MFISDLRNQGGAQARTVLDKASADAARVVANEVNRRHGISPIEW